MKDLFGHTDIGLALEFIQASFPETRRSAQDMSGKHDDGCISLQLVVYPYLVKSIITNMSYSTTRDAYLVHVMTYCDFQSNQI